MRIAPLILLMLTLSSCSNVPHLPRSKTERKEWLAARQHYSQTYHNDQAPIYFWRGSAATNGQAVLSEVRRVTQQSRARVRALLGSTVVFVADCDEPRRDGLFSDLQTRDGIEIEVDIIPFQDVRPHEPCGMWVAEVRGTLESVDVEKRVIRIAAPPQDYMVRERY